MKVHQNHKKPRDGRNELRRAKKMSYSYNVTNNNKNIISEEENKDISIIHEEEEADELEKTGATWLKKTAFH